MLINLKKKNMQVDVGAHIAELLFEHDVVHIPGLGGFVSQYKPAGVDQIQGKMLPPSKQITFDENLQVDDGLLTEALRQRYNLSLMDASGVVERYVKQVQDSLERKEIVLIPKVGRLYRDFENLIKYLPDTTNFNTEAFGLPEVHADPVVRQEPAATVKATGSTTTAIKEVWWSSVYNWLLQNLTLVGVIVAIVLALLLIWRFLPNASSNQSIVEQTPKVNVVPPDTEDSPIDNDGPLDYPADNTADLETKPKTETTTPNTTPNSTIKDVPKSNSELNNTSTQKAEQKIGPKIKPAPIKTQPPAPPVVDEPRVAPGQKVGVIAIGMFKDQANVAKLLQRINEAGYEPYTQKSAVGTRVGIQFTYDRPGEIDTKLAQIRRKFEPGAFVLKR
jgi:nucleoid DNA-binding protein